MQAIWTLKQPTLIDFKPGVSIVPSKKKCWSVQSQKKGIKECEDVTLHLWPIWILGVAFRVAHLESTGLKKWGFCCWLSSRTTSIVYSLQMAIVYISCIWSKTYCCHSACLLCFRTLPALWPTVLSKMAIEFLVARVVHLPATTKSVRIESIGPNVAWCLARWRVCVGSWNLILWWFQVPLWAVLVLSHTGQIDPKSIW